MDYNLAWLSYRNIPWYEDRKFFQIINTREKHVVIKTAVAELCRAAEEMFGMQPEITDRQERKDNFGKNRICLVMDAGISVAGGYRIEEYGGQISIFSGDASGILYGTYALVRRVQRELPLTGLKLQELPDMPLRMLDHWDNMDGSIERGYAGSSFFFKEGEILLNDRTRDYIRLAASVGINGVVINNVNVSGDATRLITDEYEFSLKRMAAELETYGITLYLSLNFAAPIELGDLDTADPEAEEVQSWWKEKMARLFQRIPNLGGFLVKADSEGRPGPFTYGRTHAQGANMLADMIKPYGGLIIWRCFVYNCTQDWRDKKTDRARSAYDNFMPLDGQFAENVILQIKNGPMDFQVREPVSPLFGSLEKTNQILEVQIAQEYTGQQKHVCYLIPMFKEILDFHTYCRKTKDKVSDIVSGRTFLQTECGMAAVANTGSDRNWTGHDLAAANWFGFGRLAFSASLTAEEIAEEWCECTFGPDRETTAAVTGILMMSWPAYEKYTSPLGIGWMVNPGNHYGPNVDGYEYDRWGTYHRADHRGIGVERGRAGTGYTSTYLEPNAAMYENIASCPEELLLFFHYIPYDYKMKSGKTLIQHIYDTHFEGVEDVEKMIGIWEGIRGKIPEEIFCRVKERLNHQREHAEEWRDQVNTYFYRKSFIADEKGRKIY